MVCRWCVWRDIRPVWNVQGSQNRRPRIWILRQRPKMPSDSEERKIELALEMFAGSNVQLILGTRLLSSVIGTKETCDKFLDGKIGEQKKPLSKLGDIVKTNPQNAHACLTKGVKHKMNFITRTTPSSSALWELFEAIIRESIIPVLTSGAGPLPIEKEIFSLPFKSGGLGIDCPENHHEDYNLSKKLSEPLEDKGPLTSEFWLKRTLDDLINAKKKLPRKFQTLKVSWARSRDMHSEEHRKKEYQPGWMYSRWSDTEFNLKNLTFETVSALDIVGIQKMPNSIAMRRDFQSDIALHCPKGGYTIVRHKEIRDKFANMMSEVCWDIAVEPLLQSLAGGKFDRNSTATEDARLDVKANGLCGTVFERTLFDVKIFSLLAKSCPRTIRDSHKYHEELKKLKYERRIRDVENSTFNPLVFSSTWSVRPSASNVMKQLAQKISTKRAKNTPMWCFSSGRN